MSKSILTTIIGITALFALQGLWLYRTYILYIGEKGNTVNDLFKVAIDKELSNRVFKYKDPRNPTFTFKYADEMTPEERANLKGDTIDYKKLSDNGTARSFTEALSQLRQEQISQNRPLQINTLDSLFLEELSNHDLNIASCQIIYMDKDTLAIDSTNQYTPTGLGTITTKLTPIGLYSSHYLKATVQVTPTSIMLELLYTLIASFGITLFIIATLYYQLVVITHTQKELKEQETTIHNAIHDLKSPLNGVFVLLNTVKELVKGDTLMENFLQKGKGQVKRMTEMIESILETTRKPGKSLLKLEVTDLIEMVSHIKENADTIFPDKKYTFFINNKLGTNTILTDKIILERCLRNLIENAFKYSDDGVNITVTFSQTKEQICIAVKDTGWGIPKKAQRHIGSPFFQVKIANKPAQPGYGIGLCSVNSQIQKLGGVFHFESEEGKGSIFFLKFPKNRK